jgi:hypothetical protein
VQPPTVQNNPESFEGAYKVRKSDVNPLDAALPQSFLRRKKIFYCVVFYTRAGFDGSKKLKNRQKFSACLQHRHYIKTMATPIRLASPEFCPISKGGEWFFYFRLLIRRQISRVQKTPKNFQNFLIRLAGRSCIQCSRNLSVKTI